MPQFLSFCDPMLQEDAIQKLAEDRGLALKDGAPRRPAWVSVPDNFGFTSGAASQVNSADEIFKVFVATISVPPLFLEPLISFSPQPKSTLGNTIHSPRRSVCCSNKEFPGISFEQLAHGLLPSGVDQICVAPQPPATAPASFLSMALQGSFRDSAGVMLAGVGGTHAGSSSMSGMTIGPQDLVVGTAVGSQQLGSMVPSSPRPSATCEVFVDCLPGAADCLLDTPTLALPSVSLSKGFSAPLSHGCADLRVLPCVMVGPRSSSCMTARGFVSPLRCLSVAGLTVYSRRWRQPLRSYFSMFCSSFGLR